MESDEGPDRQQQIIAAVIKVIVVAVAISAAIGLGTYVVVKSLGLNDTTLAGTGPPPIGPISPLPTTALPVPTQLPDQPTPSGVITDNPTELPTGGLYLTGTPQFVKPMERINLTGQWPGHDSMGLMVQRFENGAWTDFGVQTQLDVGTFATWVETGHLGDNKFRVIDPSSGTASNVVTITVG